MTFSDKIKRAREVAKMTQHDLAQEVGVSQRTIASYESGGARARKSTTEKLAHALKVSVRYLSDDDCTNPLEDIEKDEYIEQIVQYGGAAVGKSAAMPANPDLMSKPAVVAALRAHVRALAK